MQNIWILVQNYIRCAAGSLLGKKKARKGLSGVAIVALLFFGLGAFLGFQAWSLGLAIKSAATPETPADFSLLIYMGLTVGFVLVVFFALQNMTGGSRANDADLLLSMPLSKIQIITAKAISKYIIYLAINALFSVPFMVAYLGNAGFDFGIAAACLAVLILIPALAVGVNYVMDYLTIVLFGRFTFASIFRTIFSLLVICGFLALWMYIQIVLNPAMGGEKAVLFPPFLWFMDFVLKADILAFLWTLAITVLPFVLGIVLMATTLGKHNMSAKRRAVIVGAQKNRRAFMNVFLKEVKLYFSTPILMINTFIGVIMMVALAGWVVIDGGSVLDNFIGQLGFPPELLGFGLAVAFCFLCGLVCISCSSISLEGRNFWVIKTMPISAWEVLVGKALLNIVLVAPVMIIASILLWIVLELSVLAFFVLLALPICVNVFIAFGGLLINLFYPKFDWESEQQVVKQSLAVFITMLLGMGAAIVPIGIAMIFGSDKMLLISLASVGVLAALAVGSVILVLTLGKSVYERL